jgi:hypothetical protein
MSGANCTCGLFFVDDRDFRNHMPCPGSKMFQRAAMWQKRCELAEKALCLILDAAFKQDYVSGELEGVQALLEWERVRGQRFIYTNGKDYVIASGPTGLSVWFDKQGYDNQEKTGWKLVPMETPITIACDTNGNVCHGDDDEYTGTPVTRTAQEWCEKVKRYGMLCGEDL